MAKLLMTHLVAGYPSDEASLGAALGMVQGGAAYLEVQFPFSDPSADGPTIQGACQWALDRGWKPERGWKLIERIRESLPEVPLYIMAYASLVYTPGIASFCRRAREHRVTGLIVPDLAYGQDEGLAEESRKAGLDLMPVIVPSILPQRLEHILQGGFSNIYVALRSGITGTHTELQPQVLDFLESLKTRGVRVFGGFGIDSSSQVKLLAPHVHAIVVGSHLVRAIGQMPPDSKPEDYTELLCARVRSLLD